MKLLIASDLHGSAYYTEKLLERVRAEAPDRILLLGDLLYHGPRNDLPRDYDPKRVIDLLSGLSDRVFCVRGNCDSEVDQMVLPFPILADYAIVPLGRRLIYATHGHVYNKTNAPHLRQGDLLLHGHTHVPAWEDCGRFLYLNPGSVSIPKEASPHSYMTLEDGVFCWKDVQTGETYRRERPDDIREGR